MTIAALYVEAGGVYFGLEGVDPWDAARDARLYSGPWPVVAHPPCGPWGALRHLCTMGDASCGPRAVEQVRAYGGVLEHPRGSKLFAHCGMPRPWELPDAHGGRTIEVCQVDWGHPARKRTWLYVVGAPLRANFPEAREPTHWVSGGRSRGKGFGGLVPAGIKVCSGKQRRRTPEEFRDYLLDLARSVKRAA